MPSSEAQAVLDRMTALSTRETDAIINFVDSLVASGDWANIFDIWAFSLNGSDYLTGWQRDKFSLVSGITHTPGTGITHADASSHMSLAIGPANLRNWNNTGSSMGGWCLSATSTGSNADYGGTASGAGIGDWYFRNRTSNDVQAILGSSGTTPRLSPVTYPFTGFYFASCNATTRYIRVGDDTNSGANTLETTWRSDPIMFPGRNNSGHQNSFPGSHDFWFIGNENLNDSNIKAAIERFRIDLTIDYTYQWQSGTQAGGGDMADIVGATSREYTLQATEDGDYVRCVVTATDAGGSTDANSNIVGPVTGAPGPVTAVGNADGTSTATGTAQAIVTAVGNADGTATATGTAQATVTAVGNADGTATATGTAQATVTAVGNADGTSTATGVIAIDKGSGQADGTSTALGAARALLRASGQADGTATASAIGRMVIAAIGQADGLATVNGVAASPAAVGLSQGQATVIGRTPVTNAGFIKVKDGTIGTGTSTGRVAAGTSTATLRS
jgi:hypothetical protein